MTCLAILLTLFRVIVVPAQFQDREMTLTADEIAPMLEKAGGYLNDQFRGAYEFRFELASPVTLPEESSYYGENASGVHDVNIREAVVDACTSADGDIDFSEYDNDSDGSVDAVVLLTAGPSESDGAGDTAIWPQQGWLHDKGGSISLDGVSVDNFLVVTELKTDKGENPRPSGIGNLCHEFLHGFGLPDFYDTDGELSGGLCSPFWGSVYIMDEGNRNDEGNTPPNLGALEMDILGVGVCSVLERGEYTLSPLSRSDRYLKAPGNDEKEYYLFECRDNEGWDRFTGGSGLLISHIDRREPDWSDKWLYNRVNCDPAAPAAHFVCANPETDNVSGVFFPQGGHNSFSSDSDPGFIFRSGGKSLLALTGITRKQSGDVTFKVIEPLTLEEISAFQDAAIVSWNIQDLPSGCTSVLEWQAEGEEAERSESISGHTYTIEHLKPRTDYSLTIRVTAPGKESYSLTTSFRTKTYISDINPYIYLRSADRNENGTFIKGTRIPLRIFNVIDAAETEWFFNSLSVRPGADGYFQLNGSGRLKAVIHHSNGTVDIIVKDIIVE